MNQRTRLASILTAITTFGACYATSSTVTVAVINFLAVCAIILVGGYIVSKYTDRRTQALTAQRDALSLARCMERMNRYTNTGESAYARDFGFDAA